MMFHGQVADIIMPVGMVVMAAMLRIVIFPVVTGLILGLAIGLVAIIWVGDMPIQDDAPVFMVGFLSVADTQVSAEVTRLTDRITVAPIIVAAISAVVFMGQPGQQHPSIPMLTIPMLTRQ